MRASVSKKHFSLSPFLRKLMLTLHVVVSVGLLGDSAGYLAVAVQGATTGDPMLANASIKRFRCSPSCSAFR